MDAEQKAFYTLSMSHSCLYSLLVKKGLITKDEFVEHSDILRDKTIAMFEGKDEYKDFKTIMTEIYKNISDSAQ